MDANRLMETGGSGGDVCLIGFDETEKQRLIRVLSTGGVQADECVGGCCGLGTCRQGGAARCLLVRLRADGGESVCVQLQCERQSLERGRLCWLAMVDGDAVESVVDALRLGAREVLQWPPREQSLIDTVWQVLQEARTQALEDQEGTRARERLARLTHREFEVFRALAEGGPQRDIAERLGISPRTLEVHRARLYRKLRLRRATELVRLAVSAGLLEPYPPMPDPGIEASDPGTAENGRLDPADPSARRE